MRGGRWVVARLVDGYGEIRPLPWRLSSQPWATGGADDAEMLHSGRQMLLRVHDCGRH